MKQEINITVLIEKYLQGELHGEELQNFELRMKENEKFREDVEVQKLFVQGVENAGLRNSLHSIHEALYPSSVSFFQTSWMNLLAGGSFGLLIIVSFILGLNNHGSHIMPGS